MWPILISTQVCQTELHMYDYKYTRRKNCHAFLDISVMRLGRIMQTKAYRVIWARPTSLFLSKQQSKCETNRPCGLREEISAPKSPPPALPKFLFWWRKVIWNNLAFIDFRTLPKSPVLVIFIIMPVTLVWNTRRTPRGKGWTKKRSLNTIMLGTLWIDVFPKQGETLSEQVNYFFYDPERHQISQNWPHYIC